MTNRLKDFESSVEEMLEIMDCGGKFYRLLLYQLIEYDFPKLVGKKIQPENGRAYMVILFFFPRSHWTKCHNKVKNIYRNHL